MDILLEELQNGDDSQQGGARRRYSTACRISIHHCCKSASFAAIAAVPLMDASFNMRKPAAAAHLPSSLSRHHCNSKAPVLEAQGGETIICGEESSRGGLQ